MTEEELQQITIDIAEALGADTKIYWQGMHTSWGRAGDILLTVVGTALALLFFYFAIIGI